MKWSAPADSAEDARPAFETLELVFRGIEKSEACDDGGIELAEHKAVLRGTGAASSSSSIHQGDFPPPTLPFKLDLTPDMPQCAHLGHSSLEYTLTAILTHANPTLPPLYHTVPVHLTRTSPPGSLLAGSSFASSPSAPTEAPPSISPQTISVSDPISLSVRLSRTVFRRSEPVELLVRIEVPSAEAVQNLGLRLRTVSAEMIRTITVGEIKTDDQAPAGNGKARDLAEEDGSATKYSDEIEEVEHVPATTPPQITILTRSGKSARFSPTRPIVIRLLLHPPATSSCESITQVCAIDLPLTPFADVSRCSLQSTILHNITFSVRVTVGLLSTVGSTSDSYQNRDVILTRTIYIVPDTPPSTGRSEKMREVETEQREEHQPGWMSEDGPVPTYHESAAAAAEDVDAVGEVAGTGSSWLGEGSSSSTGEGSSKAAVDTLLDEEYDGYEEISMSASLSTRAPPPTIDEDVSPPPPTPGIAASSGLPLPAPSPEHNDLLPSLTPPPDDFGSQHQEQRNQFSFIPLSIHSPAASPSTPNTSAPSSPLQLHPLYSTDIPGLSLGATGHTEGPPPPLSPSSVGMSLAAGEEGSPPPYGGAPSPSHGPRGSLTPAPSGPAVAAQPSRAAGEDRGEGRGGLLSAGAGPPPPEYSAGGHG